MDYLQKNKDNLLPEFRRIWEATGFKTSGTWEEVFGKGPGKADEIFMGWNYSRYIDHVAEAGKKEYHIPMYVNAWIVQPTDNVPGDYPSGGPQDHMHDIWRAGGPQIDLLCPDIYLPNFVELTARYSRSGNTLFVPGVGGRHPRRRQRLLRHRGAQRHRRLVHGHRLHGAGRGGRSRLLPGGQRAGCPRSRRGRFPWPMRPWDSSPPSFSITRARAPSPRRR